MADATPEVCKSLKTIEGTVVLTRVGLSNCLLRPTQTPEGQRRLDLLDLPVSLHIEKATTWEAIKELALTVSRNGNAAGVLQIIPIFQLMGAPAWFFENRTVALDFKNTTARDALVAIIEQAPMPIRYTYTANTRNRSKEYLYGLVILDFPGTESDQERRFGNSERTEWWQNEKSDLWEQLKAAWRTSHKSPE